MTSWLKKFASKIKSTLFPDKIKCIFCGKELNKESKYCVCDECNNSLPYNRDKVCLKCGEKITSKAEYCMSCKNHIDRGFDKARAPFLFEEPLKSAIHKLKYHNGKYLGKYLSQFMLDELLLSSLKVDLIIPVPLNKNRLLQRGYNQSDLLLSAFVDYGYKTDTTSLARSVDTPTQTELTKKQREVNLKNAFCITNKLAFKNKSVLVVDDVFTTGSTMEEIANVLKNAGAKEVYALTLCHVYKKHGIDLK